MAAAAQEAFFNLELGSQDNKIQKILIKTELKAV